MMIFCRTESFPNRVQEGLGRQVEIIACSTTYSIDSHNLAIAAVPAHEIGGWWIAVDGEENGEVVVEGMSTMM